MKMKIYMIVQNEFNYDIIRLITRDFNKAMNQIQLLIQKHNERQIKWMHEQFNKYYTIFYDPYKKGPQGNVVSDVFDFNPFKQWRWNRSNRYIEIREYNI